MKHIVHKAYWDYEKEEQWLNEMSHKGLALEDYSWCRYVFRDAPAGKYIYRIELLDKTGSHYESQKYLKFLEETGIECVATYMRWAFLRKEASLGPFDLYSDIDSKINYYSKVINFWNIFAAMELVIGTMNVLIGLVNGGRYGGLGFNFFLGLPLVGLGVALVKLGDPLRAKIKRLQQERAVQE